MWSVGITMLNAQELNSIKIRHINSMKDIDIILIKSHLHYSAAVRTQKSTDGEGYVHTHHRYPQF